MTGKTKATMPGRLSLNALLKHRQITGLAAGGQTLHSPVLARSNYHRDSKSELEFKICAPRLGCSNHDEAAASDLHNSIWVTQDLSRRNPYTQINCVRLTYGQRNLLNKLNSVESTELASNKHRLGSEVPTNNVESCNGSAFLLYEEINNVQFCTVIQIWLTRG